MRSVFGWLCVLILAPGVKGQSPALSAFPTGLSETTEQPLSVPSLSAEEMAAPAIGQGLQHFIDAKLLIGFPTGVRLQAALDRQPNRTWVAEVFAGAAVANPVYGAGGRVFFTPARGRGGDVLHIGPGLNFYYCVGDHSGGEGFFLASSRNGYFLIPDVEIAWLHDFADHFGWEIGLDVGLGVGVWQAYGMESGRTTPIPMLSAFTGLRF